MRKIKSCCDYIPVLLESDLIFGGWSILCLHCGRSVIKRFRWQCIRAWNRGENKNKTGGAS
jgi:hypothetical protein